MLRVLLVEDDTVKARKLTQALLSIRGVVREQIDAVSTLHDAREHLRNTAYGLLILDLRVPEHIDSEPEDDGGIRLLEELRSSPGSFHIPGHVVGVTQYSELRGRGEAEFAKTTHTVIGYDPASDGWRDVFTQMVQHLVAADEARSQAPPGYGSKLAIICALPAELDAVRRHLQWGWISHIEGCDPTIYFRGVYSGAGGAHHLAYAAACPRMGMPVAAAMATKMILQFRPEFIVMTGIAAGVKEDPVRIGDVLLGDPVWDYGSGKWIENDGGREFQPDPDYIPVARGIRYAVDRVAAQESDLQAIRAAWPAGVPPHPLNVRVGPVASGAAVLADNTGRTEVTRQNRKAMGIDMEAYGVYVAAREAPDPGPKAFALKTVVDFADPRKADEYQAYGAYASAAVLEMVLNYLG